MWVLVWFFMALGAAVASPLLHPRTIEIVCAGAGATQSVVHVDDGTADWGGHVLDCPLCLACGAPAATRSSQTCIFAPMSYDTALEFLSPIVAPTAAPPPARAPPFSPSHS